MPVASMTGFARFDGEAGGAAFVWELRSVNGKGLDLRLRLPQRFEDLEPDVRRLAAKRLSRGNLQVTLSVTRRSETPGVSINEAMLAEVLALSERLVAAGHAVTPTADGLLSIRGIVEFGEPAAEEAPDAAQKAEIVAGFETALERLAEARAGEGRALAAVLSARLDEIEALSRRAERDPARSPEAIRERLKNQLAQLLDGESRLDAQRLHAEAALIAVRADIREELDRLGAHIAAARALLAEGGAVGRRLDFLSQEFNRESNTICSKSNAASLTAIGLDMKVVIDQFREQVQNLE